MVRVRRTRAEIEGRWREEFVVEEEEKIPPWPAEASFKYVGGRVPMVDGPAKVTGSATYTVDVSLKGMLVGRFLRCPYPHARILHVDTSDAEKMRGVRAVFTHLNTPVIPWYGGAATVLGSILRFQGDEVALVVAEDEGVAEDALEEINVEYERLPFVVDPREALREDAPKVHSGGNIYGGGPSRQVRGDPDKGFSQSDIVLEETFETSAVLHNSLETHSTVAYWTSNGLTVWESTQAINFARRMLSEIFNIPLSSVRVICEYMGGGFGAKFEIGKHTVMAALASKVTGRPVKISLTRTEENLATGCRAQTIQRVKAGFKRDGRIEAMRLEAIVNLGAYASWVPFVHGPYSMLYEIPNLETVVYGVYTNTTPHAAMRAPGFAEGAFGLESMMDMAAEELGIDPIELRLRNYAEVEPATRARYTSKALREAYLIGAERFGWSSSKVPRRENGKVYASGMASIVWWGGGGPPAYAEVKLNTDGTVQVLTSTQDIGTGTRTILAQIAAEELSVPIERVKVVMGDTSLELFSPGSAGSGTVASVGPAVRAAAISAREQLLDIASQFLDAPKEIIELKDGKIVLKDGEKSVTIDEISRQLGDFAIVGRGARGPNPDNYAVETFAAQFAEVEVDLETGSVRVLRFLSAHDSGRIINKLTAEGVVAGGVGQGLGYALLEQRVVDSSSGSVVNPNLLDYLLPSTVETPEITAVFVEPHDTHANVLGAKGLGEPPVIGVAAAIANAVSRATGARITKLPITPEVVLKALKKETKTK
ncbi:MAG: xanthine dehydrogenase family protein molybdopterin-binding subunit [Nitrososphaerota archaeon]|nr:xanthine dehydrogenase family protein molybdopterin-binding subunit [Candidatus Calditenuaceae archaeon]MDW8073002.1 xanthine dehydrogenase family protein molybdopterin-binding subunit [Nitrososphaerota archaeon]